MKNLDRVFVAAWGVLVFGAFCSSGMAEVVSKWSEENAPKPNIILIFVDDMGYGDLGCYGNKLTKTPNIDRLAAEGQQWVSFYSSGGTCGPRRRGL